MTVTYLRECGAGDCDLPEGVWTGDCDLPEGMRTGVASVSAMHCHSLQNQ